MTTFRLVERAKRKCEREHALNSGRWCGVQLEDGSIVVRCADKAERLVRKHPACKIVCSVPEYAEVTS